MILKGRRLSLICSSVVIFVVEFAYGILSTHNIRHKVSSGKSRPFSSFVVYFLCV